MTNAVVVTTVVTADMSEDTLRETVLEQIRSNHQHLQEWLAAADMEVTVVTTVTHTNGDAGSTLRELSNGHGLSSTVTGNMSEAEFMNYAFERLRSGEEKPIARLTDADLEEIEEESIGEHFSYNPYQY
jgi:hypothetical protein